MAKRQTDYVAKKKATGDRIDCYAPAGTLDLLRELEERHGITSHGNMIRKMIDAAALVAQAGTVWEPVESSEAVVSRLLHTCSGDHDKVLEQYRQELEQQTEKSVNVVWVILDRHKERAALARTVPDCSFLLDKF